MKGICRLCDQKKDLRDSHVIPSFVYKWLKNTSGTGFIRFGLEPNKRAQDGYTRPWLCDECEGRFNTWETEFANAIFHPMNSGIDRISYGPSLLKFCTSVSWRVLLFFIEEVGLADWPTNLREATNRANEVWKQFLLDERTNPDSHEQHLLPLEAVQSFTHGYVPTNINRYFLRTVDLDIVRGEKTAIVYSKLGRFVIVGFIIEVPHPPRWVGTKVHVRHGIIEPRNYSVPENFGDYLFGQARKMADLQSRISGRQNEKIIEIYTKDIDRIARSKTVEAMSHDVRLFGRKAFNEDSEKD